MRAQNFILLFTLFFLTHFTYSQSNYHFSHYQLEDGLSQGTIQALLQDQQGFIWLGTKDGLNRFDGYSFKVFQSQVGDSLSISNNEITSLLEDDAGNIWVGTRNGLNLFNTKSQKFQRFFNRLSDNNSISSNIITTLEKGENGIIWIGTENGGLNYYSPECNCFYQFKNNTKTQLESNIRSLLFDSKKRLWIGTQNNGVYILSSSKHEFFNYSFDTKNDSSLSNNRVIKIFEDTDKKIWIGTWEGGLNLFNELTGDFTRIHIDENLKGKGTSNNVITSIIQDNDETLWLGTWGGGINILNTKTLNIEYILPNESFQNALHTNIITNLLKDKSGNIWVGAVAKGVEFHNRNTRKFIHYTYNKNDFKSLRGNIVLGLIEDKNENLWVGTTDGGLNILRKGSNTFVQFQYDYNNKNSISSNIILSLFEDSKGNIWIGTEAGGLNKYNPEKDIFTKFYHNPTNKNSISGNTVWEVLEDKDGYLWMGTRSGGLNKYNPNTNTFIHYKNNPSVEGSISSNTVKSIYEDSKGNLWIGTQGGGLNLFNKTSETFKVYQNELNNSHSISGNDIKSIYEDSKGNLWIGTNGDGLNLYDYKNDNFTSFHKIDGLSNEVIYGILEDNSNNLWLSTNIGINVFSIDSLSVIKHFDKYDGLQNNEFNTGAYFKGKDSKLYFGGVSGVNIIDLKNTENNTSFPEVIFTDLLYKNQIVKIGINSVLKKEVNSQENIIIKHDYFPISFQFSAINISQPKKVYYQYKLQGLDRQWIDADYSQRVANYSKIEDGDYIFLVRASNDRINWSKAKSIRLTVLPPWWLTTIAKIIWFFSLMTVVYSIYKLRLASLEKQRRVLKQQVDERTVEISKKNKALEQQKAEIELQAEELKIINEKLIQLDRFKNKMTSMIVHDLKNPLNLIINYKEENSNKTLKIIRNTGKQMLNLVLNILDVQKFEEAKIQLDYQSVPFNSLLSEAVQQINYLAEEKNITINIYYKFNANAFCDLSITVRVLINLLNNALKYSEFNSTVEVTVEKEYNFIKCSVRDFGKGISQEEIHKIFDRYYQAQKDKSKKKQSTGLGLTFSKLAIESQGGSISVTSELHEGTTFSITVPLDVDSEINISNNNSVMINNKAEKTVLNSQDRKLLFPIYQQLKEIEVYSNSEINTILSSEIFLNNPRIVNWKEKLEDAVFSMNEAEYTLLLNEIAEN